MSDDIQLLYVLVPDMVKDSQPVSILVRGSGEIWAEEAREIRHIVHSAITDLHAMDPADSFPDWLSDPKCYALEKGELGELTEKTREDAISRIPVGSSPPDTVQVLTLRELVAA